MSEATMNEFGIEAFTAEAMSGDYDHVLQTCMRFFRVV
jgi:hypothetical protein